MAFGRRARRALAATALRWGILAAFSAALSFPFYWMLITTFKRTSDLYDLKNNPFLFHEPPTLEHLRLLFTETLFPRWLWNTTTGGRLVVAITLLLARAGGLRAGPPDRGRGASASESPSS